MEKTKVAKNKFKFVGDIKKDAEQTRPSLTYWADAWRRLKKNKLAMIGLLGVILIILFGVLGPYFTKFSYSDQTNDYKNMGPRLDLFDIGNDTYIHLTKDYNLFIVSDKGVLQERLHELESTKAELVDRTNFSVVLTPAEIKKQREEGGGPKNIKIYQYGDEEIMLEYRGVAQKAVATDSNNYKFTYRDKTVNEPSKTVMNKMYPFGTDGLGRDLMTRVMFGARISLLVAFVATLVNFIIGVIYGAIAGYEGGKTDNIMMRIVDIINSVPLVLYIILLMVLLDSAGGLGTIILAIGTVYWVNMARLVRGQMLSLKGQEFVLAARALGVSKIQIIFRHLIPNAMGPIIVSMTMMIPSAIFTESFLSFIGLGVSAPMASWGTLANNALSGILTYPYQLFFPAIAIAITMLAFNFLGDGLRDALDPRLRKG